VIIGAVIGSLAFLFIIAVIVVLIRRYRGKKSQEATAQGDVALVSARESNYAVVPAAGSPLYSDAFLRANAPSDHYDASALNRYDVVPQKPPVSTEYESNVL
jgi:hypothetical protein